MTICESWSLKLIFKQKNYRYFSKGKKWCFKNFQTNFLHKMLNIKEKIDFSYLKKNHQITRKCQKKGYVIKNHNILLIFRT